MLICLLRHGIAEDAGADTGYADAPRRLTRDGVERMRREAAGIRRLDMGVHAVIHSPLVRCAETAAIVADALGVKARAHDALQPGADAEAVREIAAENRGADAIVLCGHQPDMSEITYDLVRGGYVEFRKGTLAVIDIPDGHTGGGVLRAVYPPRSLRLLGGDA
ncbi:MAG: phosphohistidine phosphatase SixA [Thermoleophilia bacterium]|nr:phosphohistidine phosphatase SixA [Thermoleophilia bacterium]